LSVESLIDPGPDGSFGAAAESKEFT